MYNEHILLFENLGEQSDAFRLPVVNGTGLAQSNEPQKHIGSYERPIHIGSGGIESSAKSSRGVRSCASRASQNLPPTW